MKKNFVKKLALGLAFSVAVGSVPATNVAAAETTYPSFKSVTTKENRKSLKVGQTKKYYTKDSTKWALKRINVGNDDVATARFSRTKKFIKVTGVAVGKTQVRAVFKNYKTKEVYKGALLHVEIKEAEKEDVVVSSVPEIKEFIATKVNQLTATFASPVNTDDVTLAVTKGNSKIENTVAWNADKTVATITTVAKLTKGTYTLTATAKSDGVVKTANAAVEDQTVADIVIKDTVALTGSVSSGGSIVAAGEAYVYYDVVDQYGDSLKTSTSITWSTSCGNPYGDDRNLGKLTLRRSDGKAFTFGEQIFVTGVNAQTGKAVNATLTIGAEQALNSVEVKGFVKKNTTKVLSTLPSGFKAGAYYMIYSVVDQNGNPMDADYFLNATNASGVQQVTLISDNVLVIKEFTESGRLVTIDGVTYCAANVVPGMYVDKGGEVNITAIANKTGNKTNLNTVVGEYAILRSFVMSSPELIADGETVAIPFVATDVNGNEIKNFNVLADNINKLTFSASDNTNLTLKENNDGTATLTLTDTTYVGTSAWDGSSTDGIDRPVALTAIVVGGETNNLMVNIKDKARPDAIYNADVAEAILEGGTEVIDFQGNGSTTHADFVYLDQYGRKIAKDYNYNDNGFFNAAKSGVLSGIAFSGYEFGVKVTYKGNPNAVTGSAITELTYANDEAVLTTTNNTLTLTADTLTQTAITGENLKFEIAKVKAGENWSATSAAKNTTFAVVDVTQVKNLAVSDLGKQYVGTDKSTALTGEGVADISGTVNGANNLDGTHSQTVKVTGTFNGKAVVVPANYLDASTMDGKLDVTTGSAVVITTNPGSELKYKDLYDATTARYTRKDTKDILEVKVNKLYSNENDATFGTALATPELYDTASKEVAISDATPVPATITCEDKGVFIPTNTDILHFITGIACLDPEYWDFDTVPTLVVVDQYSKPISTTNSYKVSKVVENEEGYAENNFKVSGNATPSASVNGAERGDTFVLTITATDGNGNYVTKDVAVTVGADANARITNSSNVYLDTLVEDYLEPQRVAGLQ